MHLDSQAIVQTNWRVRHGTARMLEPETRHTRKIEYAHGATPWGTTSLRIVRCNGSGTPALLRIAQKPNETIGSRFVWLDARDACVSEHQRT